jgi:D-alanyl-D-alanine carboxypeptidase
VPQINKRWPPGILDSVTSNSMRAIYKQSFHQLASKGGRPALDLTDFKGKRMMRLFARRQDARRLSEPGAGSAPSWADPRPGHRARLRARPEAEQLHSRLLLTSGQVGMADATVSPDLADRVAQAVKPYLVQDQVPGISVAIVTDGQVALAQGYGKSNVATGSLVQADTRFDIGSVTKTFTAIGVLLLYQESQGTSRPLNLDAPISQYLHNNKSFKLPAKWSHITTRELLDMTSGIRDVGSPQPWQAQLAAIAKDPLLYAPGTKSSYSSANFDLLGELIEQWTGENYGTFIQNQVLGPLGMSATQELGRSATVPNQAVGYNAPSHGRWQKAEVQNGAAMYAAAGIVSTAQDMGTYMTALLSGRLLNPATYALMWTSTPTLRFGENPPSTALYGLGWDKAIDTSAEPAEVAKSGQVPGYISQLILYPATDSGVFVSINTNYTGSRDPNGVTALQVAQSVYAAATQTG